MVDEILNQIKIACEEAEVDVPNILPNLVRLPLANLAVLYQVYIKKQNDRRENLEHD